MPIDQEVIVALAGVVSTLAGFISYLYRDGLKRADEQRMQLQQQLEELLKTTASTLTQVAVNQAATLDLVKTMSSVVLKQQLREEILEEQRRAALAGKG